MENFKDKVSLIDWRSIFIGVGFVILTVLMFVGFRILYQAPTSEYMKEVVAGFIGAVLTIVATAALLKSQSDNELRRDQSSEVFKAKLSTYNEFIDFLCLLLKDRRMSEKEKDEFVNRGLKISLFAGDDLVIQLAMFIRQVTFNKCIYFEDLTEEEVARWHRFYKDQTEQEAEYVDGFSYPIGFITVGSMISMLRSDLGESKIVASDKRTIISYSIDQLVISRDIVGFEE